MGGEVGMWRKADTPISRHNSTKTARKGRLPERAAQAAVPLGQNQVSEQEDDAPGGGYGCQEVF